MKKAVIYIHGKGGNIAEAAHYVPLFPDCAVFGYDYKSETPWDATREFSPYFEKLSREYDDLILIANSIGAYFAMCVGIDGYCEKAYFISPVCDMEKLITDMMGWASVTEDELFAKKNIKTAFGETLSYDYLTYAREHPLSWQIPTAILYGERDNLTDYDTISSFSEKIGAALTVMDGGEHWFHTAEQMAFLDNWIRKSAFPS